MTSALVQINKLSNQLSFIVSACIKVTFRLQKRDFEISIIDMSQFLNIVILLTDLFTICKEFARMCFKNSNVKNTPAKPSTFPFSVTAVTIIVNLADLVLNRLQRHWAMD